MGGILINPAVQSHNASKVAAASLTFTGAAGIGEAATAVGLLGTTANGMVVIRDLVVFCTSSLVVSAGGLVSLGTEGSATAFIAATDATAIDVNTWWHSTTPTLTGAVTPAAARNFPLYFLSSSAAIACHPSVQNITGGVLVIYALYDPIIAGSTLSATGSAVAI